jgi:DNA-binding SARP family transcriptional activator
MEFRILGPLEVLADGDSVPLGGARQRALLAILLTRANEVVGRDALIDELWGENPPETATNVLQGYISHLRKAVGNDVLQTRAPGYVAVVDSGQLDLDRFEKLLTTGSDELAHGDVRSAAVSLRSALELWRGPALADFAFEPFAQAEIARLEELRLTALERRIEADLALGKDAELVGELETLVGRHPLRERPRAQLMLALYRAGRQAEALDAYQQARRALVDELGIDPSPVLQELEKAILRQDPSLDVAAAPGRTVGDTDGERGAIIVVPSAVEMIDALLELAEPLVARPARELIVALLVEKAEGLADATRELEARRVAFASRDAPMRAAAFTTNDPDDDLALLVAEQGGELLLVDAPPSLLDDGRLPEGLATTLAGMPCDVGILVARAGGSDPERPVLVPFGGAEHEWAAVELGAWMAGARGVALQLAGAAGEPREGKRDASRLLARAALMVQRVAGVPTEPVLVQPGDEGVVAAAEHAGLVLMGLSPGWRQDGVGPTRLAVARNASPPVLFVRRGLRPGGLAPQKSLTRFTWTMASAER